MAYRAELSVEFDADSAEEARELLRPALDRFFNEEWVIALHASAPKLLVNLSQPAYRKAKDAT